MKTTILAIAFLLMFTALSRFASAEEAQHVSEREYSHYLSAYLSNTHVEGKDEVTIGVEYERRLDGFCDFGSLVV